MSSQPTEPKPALAHRAAFLGQLSAEETSEAVEGTVARIACILEKRARRTIPLGGFLPAAVAIPLIPVPGGLGILFTVRTAHVEQHKGEISFPGGRVDLEDRDTLATALRETEEEVGLKPEDATVVGRFDDFVSVTAYRVTPYVIHVPRGDYSFRASPREVAEILLVPLDHLLNPAHHTAIAQGDQPWLVHYFRWGPYVIWGLTAAILKRFLDVAFDFSGQR